jgi:hypothetical protein
LKDPIAFFSAAWIERCFNAQVLVMVRHPAGFADSVIRTGWRFDFENFTAQPHLLARMPGEQADLVQRYAESPPEMVAHAIALWNIVYADLLRQIEPHPSWVVTRYESVASHPLDGLRTVYSRTGLRWGAAVERRIRRAGLVGNGTATTWRHRLDAEVVKRIREGCGEVASAWYGGEDW